MFDFIYKTRFHADKIDCLLDGDVDHSLATVFIDLVSGICSHRCVFCDGRFSKIRPIMFNRDRLEKMADELVRLGVSSVIIIGEGGESLLNPDFPFFAKKLLKSGIHVGLYTNGSICSDEIIEIVSKLDFVRISLDSGTAGTHRVVHGAPERYGLDQVKKFIRQVSRSKRTRVGVSFIVLDQNIHEIYAAARLAKKLGADFIEYKPEFQKNYRINSRFLAKNRDFIGKEIARCKVLMDGDFDVVLNNHLQSFLDGSNAGGKISRLDEPRSCLTCRLRLVISPTGYYPCTPRRSIGRYRLGDPAIDSIEKVWNGRRHRKFLDKPCALRCAYHDQNEYLLSLQNGSRKNTKDAIGNVGHGQKYFI